MGRIDVDRAAGALLGGAAGDALGAGYEFSTPVTGESIEMRGGGPFNVAPGEWTDDTAQAVGIAQVTSTGAMDLVAIGQRFLDWHASGPKDVGASTGAVLRAAADAADLPHAAAAYFAAHPRGASGNGSLMRTAAVALAHLGDDQAMAAAARDVSALTHADPEAGEACALWCIAIDRAVREGRLDVRAGLAVLPADRRAAWADRLDAAEQQPPGTFHDNNGWSVVALQAAWSAIHHTPVPAGRPARHLQQALVTAVRIGGDTDTVAAIAGQLLGARWGASAVPWRWRRIMHGWDGLDANGLIRLAVLTTKGGATDGIGWPLEETLVPWGRIREPIFTLFAPLAGVDGVMVGNLPGLALALDRGVDAVVSLCRVGAREVPDGVEHARFRMVDQPGEAANPNLAFVLDDALDAVTTLRAEGKTTFLHCVGGRSRTALVAAALLMAETGVSAENAVAQLRPALPEAAPNPTFMDELRRRDPSSGGKA